MKLKTTAPLDKGFMPMALIIKDFDERAKNEGGNIVLDFAK